ncbi:MAG TPA: DUF5522 domain-containing protein [Chitinophagaceae bacterium]
MKNLVENIDFYFNENGLMVLTESYLKERGYCCGSGCLHCPYNYQAVPEPRRTQLLQERNKSHSSTK